MRARRARGLDFQNVNIAQPLASPLWTPWASLLSEPPPVGDGGPASHSRAQALAGHCKSGGPAGGSLAAQ